MPVTITVSQVRRALYESAGMSDAPGDGLPSTSVLGTWFHEGLRFLIGDGSGASPLAKLADVDVDLELWKQTLVAEAYGRFVGPRLTRERAALQDAASQVLTFWQAMQAASWWLAELSWSLRPARISRRSPQPLPWQTLAECFSTEEPLTCELRAPGWSDSVRLVGVADAIVRLAHTGAWCAIEFKLGQTSPVIDLGQACLYHFLISSTIAAQAASSLPSADVHDGTGTLALVSFRPQRHEQLFSAADLVPVRQRLLDLIGKLAGVDSAQMTPPVERLASSGPSSTRSPLPAAAVAAFHPTENHLELGKKLKAALAEYRVTVELGDPPIVGPTFLRFPITLGQGMRVSAVERLAAEVQHRLSLEKEPFIKRDEGLLVIDVERPDRQTVWFNNVRGQLPQPDARLGGSCVPVGVDLSGRLICADLAKTEHCHILAAGTTGSGKSEWLRLAIAGLMVTNTPHTLRLLIIDPKRNAFHALKDSPYLWRPLVFPDEHSTPEILAELADEMDDRYRKLDGADSLAQLVTRTREPLPRIVCVCDEYRDLISRSREERKLVEAQICRLSAKARAAGIHLILATQEPRRETIVGPLDANMPARVGLRMGKSLESNMLLNESGAEKLLGYGDLLFKDIGPPRRLQAPLLSEANRTEIFGAIQRGPD